MKETIKVRAVQGVMWVGLLQFSKSGIQFVVTAILARLLFPEDFGTMGMAVIFLDLISKLNSLGFSAALIQRKDITEDHLSTAFWSNIMVGAVVCGLSAGASPFVAAFFNNPKVQPLMMVISISLIIGPIGVVHSTLLTRKLDFARNGLFQLGGTLLQGILSISMALSGYGVWSLVWGELVSVAFSSIGKWFIVDWRPSFRFKVSCFRDLFGFGIYNTGLNLITSGASNVDYFFIGKFLGAGPLGFYTLGFNLATFSFRRITTLVGRVAFPAFSRIQDDDSLMRKMYLKSVSYASLITFPVAAGLFVIAPDLIEVVYTSKWQAALLPMQILCIVGLLKSTEVAVFAVYQAKGRPDLDFKLQCVYLAVLAVGVWFGLSWGIVGVAASVAVVEVIFLVIRQYVVNMLIELRFLTFWTCLFPAAMGSVAMVALLDVYIHLFRIAAPGHATIRLASSVPIGALVYLGSVWLYRKAVFMELFEVFRDGNIFSRKLRPQPEPKH